MYPPDWPKCECGRPVLEGHLTCGRSLCSESAARERQRQAFAQVTATCRYCDWTAQHKRGSTTEEDIEIGKLMRRLVIEHVREKHSDTWKTGG